MYLYLYIYLTCQLEGWNIDMDFINTNIPRDFQFLISPYIIYMGPMGSGLGHVLQKSNQWEAVLDERI